MILLFALSGVVGAAFVLALLLSSSFPSSAAYFPRFAAIIGLAFVLIELIAVLREALARRRAETAPSSTADGEADAETKKETSSSFVVITYYLGWAAGLVVLIYLLGGLLGPGIWLLAYSRLVAGLTWIRALLGVAVIETALMLLMRIGFVTLPVGTLPFG